MMEAKKTQPKECRQTITTCTDLLLYIDKLSFPWGPFKVGLHGVLGLDLRQLMRMVRHIRNCEKVREIAWNLTPAGPQTLLNSGEVHLWNSAEILVLRLHLCTRIRVRTTIGLSKRPLTICQSGWKEIQDPLSVIRWVRWWPRTTISALLCRRH